MINGKHFIAGKWQKGRGPSFTSTNPATGRMHWQGFEAELEEVNAAVEAARQAQKEWSLFSLEKRASYLQKFAESVTAQRADLAETISRETGKPKWEAEQEVDTLIAKVGNSLEAYRDRCTEISFPLGGTGGSGGSGGAVVSGQAQAHKRFRALGIVAVLGPFNLPAHLPHSHIIPALLAGNTVVFKPSELAPWVGEKLLALWETAELPLGVLNMVHGGRSTGEFLANHPYLHGIFFTGSYAAGIALHKLCAGQPEKMLVLEMGGNNPLIVWEPVSLEAAALLTIQSAFITSGQRCVCARRLIIPDNAQGEAFLKVLLEKTRHLRVGHFGDAHEPFMGPVISALAAERLLKAQEKMIWSGAQIILPLQTMPLGPAFLSPGILDVTGMTERLDEEWFGPLLQVIRVANFSMAIAEANKTRFGLTAGLIGGSAEQYLQFRQSIKAGIVNWNRPITGASGKLPFGGLGQSGNHRPSAYYAADYCADPMASLENESLQMPENLPPGLS